MKFNHPIAVCDFSASEVRVAHLLAQRRAPFVKVLGMGACASGGVEDGHFVRLSSAAESVWEAARAARKGSGLAASRMFFGLDDPFLESVDTRGTAYLDGFEEAFGERHVREARARALQTIRPLDKHLVYQKESGYLIDRRDYLFDPIGICGKELTVVMRLLFSSSSQAQNLQFIAERAGFSVAGLFPSGLAAARGVLNEKQMANRHVIVLARKKVCYVVTVEHGAIQEYHAVLIPSCYGEAEKGKIGAVLKEVYKVRPETLWITGECSGNEDVAKCVTQGGEFAMPATPLLKHHDLDLGKHAVLCGLFLMARSHHRKPNRFRGAKSVWHSTRKRFQAFVEEYF